MSNPPAPRVITEAEFRAAIKLAPAKSSHIIDVNDVVRPSPTDAEAQTIPKQVVAMMRATSKMAYVRTIVSVILANLMSSVGVDKLQIIRSGYIIGYKPRGRTPTIIIPPKVFLNAMFPYMDGAINEMRKYKHEDFARFAGKQACIPDLAFVAAAAFAKMETFTSGMAYALSLASPCDMRAAMWSLMYEEEQYKQIVAGINCDYGKNGNGDNMNMFAFGRRINTDFRMPRNLRATIASSIQTFTEFEDSEGEMEEVVARLSKPKQQQSQQQQKKKNDLDLNEMSAAEFLAKMALNRGTSDFGATPKQPRAEKPKQNDHISGFSFGGLVGGRTEVDSSWNNPNKYFRGGKDSQKIPPSTEEVVERTPAADPPSDEDATEEGEKTPLTL